MLSSSYNGDAGGEIQAHFKPSGHQSHTEGVRKVIIAALSQNNINSIYMFV